jgi:hypothetical protein
MSNNKPSIGKGLKYIGIAIFLMFLGPILISIGFRAINDGIYFWLIIGIIIAVIAIISGFIGIKTILRGLFDNEES